ncbi:HNH nuclease domain-containing protein [Frankia sp. AiPs1]|uniref:hypothetical protein n=1 Tax=Frankia sp. AiPa1 TaxID=573492 RepID=UPI00202AF66A|nr:hypothetical protein [Frankia sp. AiPa1]MCL9762639.1 hypothetical protein [Frankia sp. AiPa1]
MRILLQPAAQGTKAVRGRYERTILNPVNFAEHEDLLSAEDREDLKEIFPGEAAPMWGLTPGKNGSNRKKIGSFHVGDAVFFYSDRALISGGTIAYRFRNAGLARRLWGEDKNDLTWEHMYAIGDLRRVRISFTEISSVIGWKSSAVLQQAHIITDRHADYLAELWGLDVSTADDYEIEERFISVSEPSFDGPLDRNSMRAQRVEQGQLKRLLLARGGNRCALCGREFPAKLLVAAHIKKRAACMEDEKRDLANVGMLACLLGCDSLYEHGFVGVGADGHLLVPADVREIPPLDDYAETHYVNRTCNWWSPTREPYFSWHRAHTFRMRIDAA